MDLISIICRIYMQLAFPVFTFEWVDYFFPTVLRGVFFFWLTQNGCRCGKHMLKVVEYYFHPEERPDISSFRLCEFFISQWPSNTGSAASDNRNQGETLGGKPQIYLGSKNWWPHVFLGVWFCERQRCQMKFWFSELVLGAKSQCMVFSLYFCLYFSAHAYRCQPLLFAYLHQASLFVPVPNSEFLFGSFSYLSVSCMAYWRAANWESKICIFPLVCTMNIYCE